jgi:hypothetical protein
MSDTPRFLIPADGDSTAEKRDMEAVANGEPALDGPRFIVESDVQIYC